MDRTDRHRTQPGGELPETPGGPQVLVLDDDALVRKALLETLEHAGYQATGASNGVEGFTRMSEGLPGLIVLDMLMPGMDGFEFLARLRANAAWADIPVLILSSLGEALRRSVDRAGRRSLGVFAIVTKPVESSTFLELVGVLLGTAAPGPAVLEDLELVLPGVAGQEPPRIPTR